MKLKDMQISSIDQTGIAVINLGNNKEEIIPLFSENLVEEAHKLLPLFGEEATVKHVFISNNMLTYKIEDLITDYRKDHHNPYILPEVYMEELISGFPFITGLELTNTKGCYI